MPTAKLIMSPFDYTTPYADPIPGPVPDVVIEHCAPPKPECCEECFVRLTVSALAEALGAKHD